MRAKARAHFSRNWKVSTPEETVAFFWKITHQYMSRIDNVLDMGAGDGRLSFGGNYKKYTGVEIDRKVFPNMDSPKKTFLHGCVFEHSQSDYSACIGNPPYLRHNEISKLWRDKITGRFRKLLDVYLDHRANLYTYFLLLGLQKTKSNGIVSLIIPYEWAFLPSSKPIRDYILSNGWSVFIYRFKYLVFENVQTTASISIIKKSCDGNSWKYFDIEKDNSIKEVKTFTDTGESAIEYENRGSVWAMRGLSPGSQKAFTLIEQERINLNLTKRDVLPCVTSLKALPENLKVLNMVTFKKYFISKNKKCWLIKTDRELTDSLKEYVKNVPIEFRNTWTCENQKPWYKYRLHPTPRLLFSAAFKETGPRILFNKINAIAVGSVIGIHTDSKIDVKILHKKLLDFDFNSRIVPREEGLKKIAIRQVNSVLNHLTKNTNGRKKQ